MPTPVESFCRYFGAASCESITAHQAAVMGIVMAVAAVAVVWIVSRALAGTLR